MTGVQTCALPISATNGSTVVLNSGVNAGDIVQIFSLRTMAVVNFLPLSGGTISGSITVGNSTVNATHNSSAFFITGNNSTLATAKYWANGVIIGNSSVVAAPTVYLANSTGNTELTVASINFAGNTTTLANVTLSGNGLNIGNSSGTAAPVIHMANTTETLDVGVNYIQMAGNNTTLAPVLINGNGASFGTIAEIGRAHV